MAAVEGPFNRMELGNDYSDNGGTITKFNSTIRAASRCFNNGGSFVDVGKLPRTSCLVFTVSRVSVSLKETAKWIFMQIRGQLKECRREDRW